MLVLFMYLLKLMQSIPLKIKIPKSHLTRILLPVLGLLMWLSAEAQVQELYLKGISNSNRGIYPEAIDVLQEALSIDNNNPDCLLALAQVYRISGDLETARKTLEKLKIYKPGMGSLELARIYAYDGKTVEAIMYLREHLGSNYKIPSSEILLDKAFASIEDTDEWRDLWSGDWYTEDEVLIQDILYQINSGEYMPALEKIDDELEVKGDWDALHAARGRVLLKMVQNQGAVQSYSSAIELNSTNPGHYSGRAGAYIAQEKHKHAISDLEKAYRLEPENFELLSQIGLQYQVDGQYSKALEYLEDYLAFYPDNVETRYNIGLVYFETGSYLDALRYYNSCLQFETSDPKLFIARGQTYLKTSTYKYALYDFGMALDLDPVDPETWYLKAQARWYMNDREGALGDWERAARLGSIDAVKKLEEHTAR